MVVREETVDGEWEVWWWWWRRRLLVNEKLDIEGGDSWWWMRSLVMMMKKTVTGEWEVWWWGGRSLMMVREETVDGECEVWWWGGRRELMVGGSLMMVRAAVREKFDDDERRDSGEWEIWWCWEENWQWRWRKNCWWTKRLVPSAGMFKGWWRRQRLCSTGTVEMLSSCLSGTMHTNTTTCRTAAAEEVGQVRCRWEVTIVTLGGMAPRQRWAAFRRTKTLLSLSRPTGEV